MVDVEIKLFCTDGLSKAQNTLITYGGATGCQNCSLLVVKRIVDMELRHPLTKGYIFLKHDQIYLTFFGQLDME